MIKTKWVGVRLSFVASFLFLISLAFPAKAAFFVMSDFDDTLVETRESFGGTFQTPIILFRIDQRANTLQDVPTGPKEVRLSPVEYHRNISYFAKGNGQPGVLNREIKLQDGSTIRPGLYYLRNPESFQHFFSNDERNHVLEDLKAARKADPEGKWKGIYWDHMVRLLSQPETAKSFGIITARGHSEAHWQAFFKYLKAQGEIDYLPNFRLFHNVSRPEYDKYSLDWDTAEAKVGVLTEIINHLGRTPATEPRLSPDGKAVEPYHFLIFADDNQKTIERAIREFRAFAQNKTVRVKFGVFNMGNRTEVSNARRPQFAIIKPDGTFRHATEAELIGEPDSMFAPSTAVDGSCASKILDPTIGESS